MGPHLPKCGVNDHDTDYANALRRLIGELCWRQVEETIGQSELGAISAQLARRELDPYAAAESLLVRTRPPRP